MTEPMTVLVVDDDADIVDQLSLILARDGYKVVVAQNEPQAEDALLSGRPDLILCDLMMENMDSGFIVCHQAKRLYPEVPIIMLTGVTATTGLDFSSPSAGPPGFVKADRLLHKPVNFELLRTTIGQLLAARNSRELATDPAATV